MMNAKLARLITVVCCTTLVVGSVVLPSHGRDAQFANSRRSMRSLANYLSGQWQSDRCEEAPQSETETLYLRRTFSFSKNNWAIKVLTHSDPACKNQLLEIDIAGRYLLEGFWRGIPGATAARFTHDAIRMTPHTRQMVQVLSRAGCADGNWSIGKARDVSKTGCLFIPSVSQCPVEYDVIRPNRERLFFGLRSSEGLCSPKNRPTQLESEGVVRVSS